MAEKIVSPGVFTKENDLSFLQQGVASIGTAFVGPFKEGPLVPTLVNTQVEFENLFGTVDDTYYTPIAVQKYLKEAGAATVCRVAGIGGYTEKAPTMLILSSSVTGSASASLAIVFSTVFNQGFSGSVVSTDGIGGFVISGSGLPAISASASPTAVNNIEVVLGSDPRGSKKAYSYKYFGVKAAALLAAVTGSGSITAVTLSDQTFPFDAQEAKTPYIQSQLISGQRYNLFRFETIGAGNAANTKVKIGISNIKPAGSSQATAYGTFTVTVRAFGDTNRRRNALETYSNVNLDPSSPNFLYRVIGDRHLTFDSEGRATETGDWVNKSKYVRLVNTERDSTLVSENIPVQAIPFAHAPYKLPVSASAAIAALVPAATFTTPDATQYGGINLEGNGDNSFYCNAIPATYDATSGSYTYCSGSNVAYSLDTTSGLSPVGSLSTDVAKRNILIVFQEGFDGQSPVIPILKGKDMEDDGSNTQGLNCATLTSSGSVAYQRQFSALSSDQYDIQMLVTPGLNKQYHSSLVDKALDLVTDRADSFYVIDGTSYTGTISNAKDQAASVDSNYAAMYYPWVKTVDVNTNKLIAIPPSVLMPAVFAANDRVAAEWFAPAGLNRGGLNGAVAVLSRLTQADRDNLYEAKVNPIVQFPGQGIVVFGQKTLQDKPSALDRINVRRLLLTVRKYIASTSRYLIFEQNTSTTRNRFLNIVNPYLESIQQRQGLYAFKVVMDASNNTPDTIDRNFLNGSIYLQPTKTAEFIQIDFNILPTGASFGG
jgi:hypothetical protein